MKLVGPWISGFTRRTGITMKLLGIPFEHLNLDAYAQKEAVRRYSPMGKVPALVLDDGHVLIDSAGIIDVLHEMAGPGKALIPPSGAPRLRALQLIGIGLNIYPKLTALYEESLRPENLRLQSALEGFAEQAIIGLKSSPLLGLGHGHRRYAGSPFHRTQFSAAASASASASPIIVPR